MHQIPHQQQRNLPLSCLSSQPSCSPPFLFNHQGAQTCPSSLSKCTTAPSTTSKNQNDTAKQSDKSRIMATSGIASCTRSSFSSSSSPYSPSTPLSTHKPFLTPTPTMGPCFLLLALAYMSPWTIMGSLVSYFRQNHGPAFFVKLNCAYYVPGLPLALLQQHYDSTFDSRFGSYAAYLARIILAIFVLTLTLLCLPSVPASDAATLLGLTSIMGTFSWLAHGTASTVVSIFPPAALVWLQSGFRMPEIYTLGKRGDELGGK